LYGWKENSMLTNCFAACAHYFHLRNGGMSTALTFLQTVSVSEIERDICEKIIILSYPLAFDAPVSTEKVERCRYPMVKKFQRYVYMFRRDPRT